MGILNIDHPDVRDFIHCKDKDGTISNFNISVGVYDSFMEKVAADPQGDEARLLDEIAETAWRTGDPGIIFLDAINRGNMLCHSHKHLFWCFRGVSVFVPPQVTVSEYLFCCLIKFWF